MTAHAGFLKQIAKQLRGLASGEQYNSKDINQSLIDQNADYADMQKKLEAISENDQKFHLIIRTIPHCVWLANKQGAVSFLNQAWNTVTGQPFAQGLGLGWLEMIHPHDRDVLFDRHGQFIPPSHASYQAECRIYSKKSKKWRHFTFTSSLLVESQASSQAWMLMATDISDRKEAESQLRELEGALAMAGRVNVMGEVTASLAHELSQPLAAAMNYANGCVRLLESNDKNALVKSISGMEGVVKEAERAAGIISRLRNTTTRNMPARVPCDLNALVTDAIEYFEREIDQLEIKIFSDLADGLPSCKVDQIEIMQVLVNLLSNAIDAVSDCEPGRRTIQLKTQTQNANIEIHVIDTGIGLSKEIGEEGDIFDQFYTTKTHGLGMGLAISQTIIEKYGGQLNVSSQQNQGTHFIITLPLNHGGIASG